MWPRDPGVTATSQITSNLLALNNNMDLAHKTAVWAGLLGTSLSAPLGVSWEGSKAGGWNHFSAHSLTCLVVDAGFGWALIWETDHMDWASSQHGKWAQRAYPGTGRERKQASTRQKMHLSFWPRLTSHTASLLPHSVSCTKSCWSSRGE